ncbi:hypothetical protein [Rathayibacter sp. VKM Ac-2857]|uniref:hypothetical protein n=1 Tax=Rathayibacter sp. VKM Ac-2857 TaxID=2739020 RepID=UPI0015667048|nr:hypothetical protein [Rathayibacter sp. VKM Ac-2857]NQX17241.1 hypothetical protein [Rathayibacter sp. VKM Ac-2857]
MFIGFMGVPGCGKSATAHALAMMLGGSAFLEPEEPEWSPLVTDRQANGQFGPYLALQWFRNTRVPGYLEAAKIHASGGDAVVDSMYDKLIARYMADESMRWLISPENPYFDAAQSAAEVDYASLPDPTHLVFVQVDEPTWNTMLTKRGREFDAGVDIGENLAMQELMSDVARAYTAEKGVEFIVHRQQVGSPEETAEDVRLLLESIQRYAI